MTSPAGIATLDAWLCHLETLHPQKIDLTLERVTAVAQRLGVKPAKPRSIIVAGTNGKGSCVATIAALLACQGVSVGCYTSPHLQAFNERISVDGVTADDEEIMAAFVQIERARADISLSYFEFATLAALVIFQWREVTYQILEVGLGGRLDAVNLVDADACVVTSIGLDHTEWLGDTRELIAPEKAAVARPGIPAVVAEEAPPDSLLPALDDIGARSWVLGRDWHLEGGTLRLPDNSCWQLPVTGSLQPSNMGAAVAVLWALGVLPAPRVGEAAMARLNVPGRQQKLCFRERRWVFDVAHNVESVERLVEALLADRHQGNTHMIFGAMADKPLHDMIRLMRPVASCWLLPSHANVPRAAQTHQLAADIRQLNPEALVSEYGSPMEAHEAALAISAPSDRIVVFGSFITVGAQLDCLQMSKMAGGKL